MKKFFSGFLAVILLISFVTCVYLYGTDRQFSLYVWFCNLADIGELVSFRSLSDIWTKETYWARSEPPEGWAGSSEGEWMGMEELPYEKYTGSDPTLKFFSELRGFFLRLLHTIKEFVSMLLKILSDIEKLFPWTATVPRGG